MQKSAKFVDFTKIDENVCVFSVFSSRRSLNMEKIIGNDILLVFTSVNKNDFRLKIRLIINSSY